MFKKLLEIFRKDNLLDRAYQRSFKMLDITQWMFLEAKKSIRRREDNEIDLSVKEKDREINSYECEVRRMVFNHLAVRGTSNLASGLVLVSILIDIERIGDYTKNMVDLALVHPGRLHGGKFEREISRIEDAVEHNFTQTKRCFEEESEALAYELLKEYAWVNSACDAIEASLIEESDGGFKPGDAVALALYIRWLKRINSHLKNITTSVVNPFDQIGFKPKEDF